MTCSVIFLVVLMFLSADSIATPSQECLPNERPKTAESAAPVDAQANYEVETKITWRYFCSATHPNGAISAHRILRTRGNFFKRPKNLMTSKFLMSQGLSLPHCIPVCI